jgi:hypothetical protein
MRWAELKGAEEANDWKDKLLEEAAQDAVRLNWIEQHLIEGKWDGTIGRPKSWYMVGPYRHALHKLRGNTLREAIDTALAETAPKPLASSESANRVFTEIMNLPKEKP